MISENTENLQISRISITKHYPKLLHPVHGNDKMSILIWLHFFSYFEKRTSKNSEEHKKNN